MKYRQPMLSPTSFKLGSPMASPSPPRPRGIIYGRDYADSPESSQESVKYASPTYVPMRPLNYTPSNRVPRRSSNASDISSIGEVPPLDKETILVNVNTSENKPSHHFNITYTFGDGSPNMELLKQLLANPPKIS